MCEVGTYYTMGNNGSKKRNKTFEKFETEGEGVNILERLQDAEEKGIDSYDKLMAWLLQMATNDETNDAARSTQIDEIKKCCAQVKEKRDAWRQHSTSCDSYTSVETSQLSRSGKSEDFLDIKSRMRVPLSSRETTLSDEDDTSSNDGKKHLTVPSISRQTTYSDEEESGGSSIYERTNHRFLLPLSNPQTVCTDDVELNERDCDVDDVSERTILVPPKEGPTFLDPRDALKRRRKNFRMSGGNPIFSASVGQLPDDNIPLTSGLTQKSASIAVMRQPKLEREQVLDTPLYENYGKVLDNKLLDRNIHDILLSVEVLFHDK